MMNKFGALHEASREAAAMKQEPKKALVGGPSFDLKNQVFSDQPLAVLFSGRNGLDFSELRTAVIRIPEVTIRLREAQAIIDEIVAKAQAEDTSLESNSAGWASLDLMNYVASDDYFFFRNITLKTLSSAIVQIGLFDRYLKSHRFPRFLAGPVNSDSALGVVTGQVPLRNLIEKSPAVRQMHSASAKPASAPEAVPPSLGSDAPILAGISLAEFRAVQLVRSTDSDHIEVQLIADNIMDMRKVVSALAQEGVMQFVNIGPLACLRGSDFKVAAGTEEIQVIDSIELEPLLGWFWQGVRPQAVPLAQ